jgi:hypothetical protein
MTARATERDEALFPEPEHVYPTVLAETLAEWRGSGPTFDGLTIVPLGEDRDTYIAAGHIDPARFLTACRELDDWLGGAMGDLDDDECQPWLRHVQAAVIPHCAVDSTGETAGHPKDCNCDGPWVTWATDDPGPKYSATILELS